MDKNNLPAIKNEGIFAKIKSFFSKMFFNNVETQDNYYNTENEVNIVEKEVSSTFKDSIQVQNGDNVEILSLQEKFEKGVILEKDLDEQQKESLTKLYKDQISKLKESIERRKLNIEQYKQKMIKYKQQGSSI